MMFWAFILIVLSHFAEHIAQVCQIYVFGVPKTQAFGLLGALWPAAISHPLWIEVLHYGYALLMLVGLYVYRHRYSGEAGRFWHVALWIQVWHHFEHVLLISQAITGVYLFGGNVPTSVLQAILNVTVGPGFRPEIHFTYSLIVLLPMVYAMVIANMQTRRIAVHAA